MEFCKGSIARFKQGSSLCGVALAAVVASCPVYAQDTAQDTAADGDEDVIMVTAQKRAENVQDVPIAIDAIGAEGILDRRITSSDDLVKQFPNLSLKTTNSFASGFAIRGVGTQNLHLTAQQAVGQYIDEVSMVTPFTSQLGFFDMERIEVLRGPQNTLFGRNTTGGAVNYITNKPSVSAGVNGYARAMVGSFNRLGVEGAVGLSLGESFAIRVAGQFERRDGPFNNLVDGSKLGEDRRYGVRIGLMWEPSALTEVLLSGHAGYNRGERRPFKAVGRFEANGVTPCAANLLGTAQFESANTCVARNKARALFNPSVNRWRDVYDVGSLAADTDYEGGLLRIEHDFGFAAFTSLTSYDSTQVNLASDFSGLPYLQFQATQDARYDVFSQEVRLVSTTDGPLQWIVGGFYSHEEDELATIVRNNAVGPPTLAPTPTVTLDQTAEIFSLYGQLDFAVTDRLNISGGLRWTSDRRQGDRAVIATFDTVNGLNTGARLPSDFLFTRDFVEGISAGFTTLCAPGVVPCRSPATPVTQNLSRVAGKIGIDYEVADDVMLYASYATGFKSGSFDVRAQAAFNGSGNTPVGPESLTAYEAGVKSEWFDRMLQVNAAVFRYDWDDLQAFGTIPGIGPAFLNVPGSRLVGQELEIVVRPGGGFELQLSGAHLDSQVTDVGTLTADAATVGSRLQQTPEWSFNGTARQSFDIGSDELTLSASLRHTSSQFTTLTEKPNTLMTPTTFIDLNVRYDFGAEDQYSFSIWADNITSEKSCASIVDVDGFTWTNVCLPNEGTALFGASVLARF